LEPIIGYFDEIQIRISELKSNLFPFEEGKNPAIQIYNTQKETRSLTLPKGLITFVPAV